MRAIAPAKVILSGEHAVLYGMPALALAVRCYADVNVTSYQPDQVLIELPDLPHRVQVSTADLYTKVQRCYQRHQAYLQGQCPIGQVAAAEELLMAAVVAVQLDGSRLRLHGLHLRVRSAIPLGAGMGSSAAVIAAAVHVLCTHFAAPFDLAQQIATVSRIEQLQHGRSSGLDPTLCCAGGLLRFQQGVFTPISTQLPGCWMLINTGQPQSSTGNCVEQVRQNHGASSIWGRFAEVTDALQQALQSQNAAAVGDQLRHNHQLLNQIGVVPPAVVRWIAQLENQGCSAKLCGAGAVAGEAGGMLLVYHPEQMPQLTLPSGYTTIKMELDTDGARLRS